MVKSTSPTSANTSGSGSVSGRGSPRRSIARASSSSSSLTLSSGPLRLGQSKPATAARRCTLRASRSAGSDSGTSWKIPSRPSCSDLISSQRSRTRPGVDASASPKTCGCRRTSFSCTPRATDSRSPASPLLEQQRQEVDLEEQITELAAELGIVAGDRRVGDLVGLLERVRDDRQRRLLPIPGAVATELRVRSWRSRSASARLTAQP